MATIRHFMFQLTLSYTLRVLLQPPTPPIQLLEFLKFNLVVCLKNLKTVPTITVSDDNYFFKMEPMMKVIILCNEKEDDTWHLQQ